MPNSESRFARPLVLGCVTLAHVPPSTLARIAADTGFDGLTVRIAPPRPDEEPWPMRGDTTMMREVQKIVADTGLIVQDVEVIRLNAQTRAGDWAFVFEAAQRLGAHFAAVISDDDDDRRNADNLGALAELGAAFDVKPWLEFMTYTKVRDLEQARRVVELTGRDDVFVMVDAVHLCRSGGTAADVARLDPARLPYLQICDTTRQPLADALGGIAIEARAHRLLPGDGDLDLPSLLRAIPDTVVVVEAPVTYLQERHDDAEVARLAYAASRSVLDAS